MAKKTIAQLREESVHKLAIRSDNYDTDLEIYNKARHAFNCFYRLAGMDERLLYLQNNERTCNLKSTEELYNRSQRALDRLRELMKEFHADIAYFGFLPSIIDENKTEHGGCITLNLEWWYPRKGGD